MLLVLPVGTVKGSDEGVVIHEADTEYQYARVVEMPDGERHLELNEGLAVHSVYRPDTVLTGNVWDGYLIEPFAVRDEPPGRIAILGNGAGTTARAYAEYFPDTVIDGVEIDGELHEIGKRWFGLRERPQLHLYTEDARPFLRRTDERYDAIFVDAYRQPYIPFYLTTTEFFMLAKEKLNPGGVVIVNVGHPEGSEDSRRSCRRRSGRSSRTWRATRSRTSTPCWWQRRRSRPRTTCVAPPRRSPPTYGRSRCRPRPGWPRRCAGARSTPTTTPPSNG